MKEGKSEKQTDKKKDKPPTTKQFLEFVIENFFKVEVEESKRRR